MLPVVTPGPYLNKYMLYLKIVKKLFKHSVILKVDVSEKFRIIKLEIKILL